MKRRLNILCVLVLLVLGYSVAVTAYYMGLGMKAGVEASQEIMESSDKEAMESFRKLEGMEYIGLIPRSLNQGVMKLLSDSIYNEKSGEYVPVMYSSMAVSVRTNRSWASSAASGVLGLLTFVAIVWAIVLFFKLIVAVNRSHIFNWQNVRRLRRMGLLLIAGFGCSLLSCYLSVCSLREVLVLQNYDLSISDLVNTTILVIGLTALIVAEVFAIGLKLQEEQDLTI
ncbi:DUF2975 domain-containing protein [uncultured Bacteroides sp.]|uniref:DUF2975 domain-containing protein n=1 Tax=uncultured Bacteroides sp. TaxID=162156 RepID=UPI00263373BC|nr:DUF2975 domain-containing protein [uncultured Bacteroides sp.]